MKPHNDPERLFTLIHEIISAQEDWQTALAPRVILGLWHPRFILATIKIVPYLRRSYIGASISRVPDPPARKDAQAAGKDILVWTVNRPEQMMEVRT